MTMEDVWVETVHEAERRDTKKNHSVEIRKEKALVQEITKRRFAKKDNRAQGRKRAA